MHKLFNPSSVAIIGASRHKEKIGYQILDNLIKSGYEGKIFPVNPSKESILNLKTYSSVSEVLDEIDLAVVVVPKEFVFEVLQECVKKYIPYAIIISSGFAEVGPKGREIQEKIKNEIIEKSNLRIIGPNCLGILNTNDNLNLTFAAPKLIDGGVSAVFQSGALGASLLDLAQKFEFGFAKFVSLGNKVDLEESEIIEYLANDDDTHVIALYVEEISKPLDFLKKAALAAKKKPVVILKGGVTSIGAKAAFSHTAAMVSPAHINRAIFSQTNLIVANTIDELLGIISILSCEPPVREKKLGIITNAGGPGILATDSASFHNFKLLQPDKETLQKELPHPDIASLANPLDLTGAADANDYEAALNYFLNNNDFSSILLLLTPQTATEIEKTADIISKNSHSSKPIISSFLGDRTVKNGIEILRRSHSPHFEEPSDGISALAKVIHYWQKREEKENIIDIAKRNQKNTNNIFALQLASDNNIAVAPFVLADTILEGSRAFQNLKKPLALKLISKDIVHKFKSGKVVLNISTEREFQDTASNLGMPLLVQEMIEAPIEVLVGTKRDERLGIIITFGWGGIFTEDLKDISSRIWPLTYNDLDEMIKETKIGQVLQKEKIDLKLLKEIIVNIIKIMLDYPTISEFELNPIKVSSKNVICVDARYKE